MFCFGSETNGIFTFVQNSQGHVYTWPSEKLAREYFNSAEHMSHLYRLDLDLGVAHLVEQGDNLLGAPAQVEPTWDQKAALFESFVYKSLLEWTPMETIDGIYTS